MVGFKSTLIVLAIGLISSLSLAYLWKAEQAQSARLEGELIQALANTETLKQAISDQQNTVEKLFTVVKANQQTMDELFDSRDEAIAETARVTAQINRLRTTEAIRALEAPFARGNIARERFNDSLQRISGAPGGEDSGSDSPDLTGIGYP